jgi:multidrug efflux system membrane fusion protein
MKTFMSKRLLIAFALGLTAIGGGVAFYAGDAAAPAAAAPEPPRVPVVTSTVQSKDVPIYLRGVGTVIAYNNVIVRSQVDQTEANRDRDQAQLINAQSNLDRYTKLGANGWATPQLIETQKAQLGQLQAMVKSDEALIEAANVNLSYTKLTAPIDGVTGIRQIDNGNVIHPTDPNGLVDVTQIQPISVIFTLPETDFSEIQAQMAKGPLSVLAYTQDDKTELDSGTLELIDNQIIQTTGTIRLRATFPNAKKLLWPGELIDARLLVDTRHNGLTMPPSAVQQGPHGSYVYAVGPDDRAQLRPVTVAQISDGEALIDSGLQPNETVVVDGQYGLQPGSYVNVLHGQAAQEANLTSAVEQAIP